MNGKSGKKIDDLAALLERTGSDPERLALVRTAQTFKRSWVELAEGLVKVRATRAYIRWGFDDFYEYCSKDLQVKRTTADKLVHGYSTVQKHVPEVLQRDGVAAQIPTLDAINYFAQAVDPASEAPPPEREVEREIRRAVFDEGLPVNELRKRFDPVLHPRPKGADRLELINKASACARKLAELLPDIPDLPDRRVKRLEEELGALRESLETLAEPLREQVRREQQRRVHRPLARAS